MLVGDTGWGTRMGTLQAQSCSILMSLCGIWPWTGLVWTFAQPSHGLECIWIELDTGVCLGGEQEGPHTRAALVWEFWQLTHSCLLYTYKGQVLLQVLGIQP